MVTEVAVVLVLVLPSVVVDDSSEVEVVSEVALSDFAHEFIYRLKKKISKISININFKFEIFFNEKEMRPISNTNTVNIINHLGINEKS